MQNIISKTALDCNLQTNSLFINACIIIISVEMRSFENLTNQSGSKKAIYIAEHAIYQETIFSQSSTLFSDSKIQSSQY